MDDAVRAVQREPAAPPVNPIAETPPVTAVPGFRVSSGGSALLTGSNYKWRVRVGKIDQSVRIDGAQAKLKTGKVGELKDF